MIGVEFHTYIPEEDKRTPFDRLLPLFVELLNYTNGDPGEALDFMEEIDRQRPLFSDTYTRDDFEQELKRKGYLREKYESGGKGGKGKGGKFGNGKNKKSPQSRSARAGLQVSYTFFLFNSLPNFSLSKLLLY